MEEMQRRGGILRWAMSPSILLIGLTPNPANHRCRSGEASYKQYDDQGRPVTAHNVGGTRDWSIEYHGNAFIVYRLFDYPGHRSRSKFDRCVQVDPDPYSHQRLSYQCDQTDGYLSYEANTGKLVSTLLGFKQTIYLDDSGLIIHREQRHDLSRSKLSLERGLPYEKVVTREVKKRVDNGVLRLDLVHIERSGPKRSWMAHQWHRVERKLGVESEKMRYVNWHESRRHYVVDITGYDNEQRINTWQAYYGKNRDSKMGNEQHYSCEPVL